MQTALALTLLVLVTGVQFSEAESCGKNSEDVNAPECDAFYSGTDWPGNDFARIDNVGTAQECCRHCRYEYAGCKAYIYDSEEDQCWLKSAVSSPQRCDKCHGRNELEEKPSESCNALYGVDRTGGDYDHIEQITQPGACCDLCAMQSKCVAWTWDRSSNSCWLKDELKPVKLCNICVTGDRSMNSMLKQK